MYERVGGLQVVAVDALHRCLWKEDFPATAPRFPRFPRTLEAFPAAVQIFQAQYPADLHLQEAFLRIVASSVESTSNPRVLHSSL